MAIMTDISCDIESCDQEIMVRYMWMLEDLKEAGWDYTVSSDPRSMTTDVTGGKHFCPDHKLKGRPEDG